MDFVEAAHAAAKDTSPEGRLFVALSLALAKSPIAEASPKPGAQAFERGAIGN